MCKIITSSKNMDVISIKDFSKKKIENFLVESEKMFEYLKNNKVPKVMQDKILGTLFFEPSTRTRLSFTSAMYKLGGQVLGFGSTESSSISKGENLNDTIKVVENYCDIFTIRHPDEGAARYVADITDKPVINCGDGGNQHPTQTILDLYSIQKLKGKIEGLNIALLGDLKHARVMKSLASALCMFKANLRLISPVGLEMGQNTLNDLKKFNTDIIETNNIKEGLKNVDVIYVCRIQKERFDDVYDAQRLQREFRLKLNHLSHVNKDLIILHALPKLTEISPEIDNTSYAKYFEQVYYGIPVRMAILNMVVE